MPKSGPKPKPKPTDQEALYLIAMRRERAKGVMNDIFHGIDHSITMPSADQLLDYLSSMCSCLELQLKLLSGDWGSHEVSKMYETVTGSPHPNPDFMTSLKGAIMHQKYLLAPVGSIIDYVPEIEQLYDALQRKLMASYSKFQVRVQLTLPDSFNQYLFRNVERFFSIQSGPIPPGTNMGASLKAHTDAYHARVARIRSTLTEFFQRGHKLIVDHFRIKLLG